MGLGRLFKTCGKAVGLAGGNANDPTVASRQATHGEGFFRNPPAGPASVSPFPSGAHQAAPPIDLQALIVPETVNGPTTQLEVSEILTRAQALQKSGRHDEAKSFYGRVLSREPRNADALHGLGMLALDQGDVSQAEVLISAAINLDPQKASYHSNFGHLMRLRGETQAALHAFETAIRLQPQSAVIQCQYGDALREAGRFDTAEIALRRAMSLDRGYAVAHWKLAQLQLLLGRYGEGWSEFRWGFEAGARKWYALPLPEYDGGEYPEATVVVWADRNIADQIMFAQLLPRLRERVGDVVVVADDRLTPLFAEAFPGTLCFSPLEPMDLRQRYPRITHHLPMCELPKVLCPDPAEFGYAAPYLRADREKTAALRSRYAGDSDQYLVGIAWRGGGWGETKAQSAVPFELWAEILSRQDLRFVSLEAGDPSEDIAAVQNGLGVEIYHDREIEPKSSLEDYAAQIAACDTVITLDSLTAHLAGALSIRTKLLLPLVADWRWGIDGRHTPWYHSLELFRQPRAGDWRSAVQQLAASL